MHFRCSGVLEEQVMQCIVVYEWPLIGERTRYGDTHLTVDLVLVLSLTEPTVLSVEDQHWNIEGTKLACVNGDE